MCVVYQEILPGFFLILPQSITTVEWLVFVLWFCKWAPRLGFERQQQRKPQNFEASPQLYFGMQRYKGAARSRSQGLLLVTLLKQGVISSCHPTKASHSTSSVCSSAWWNGLGTDSVTENIMWKWLFWAWARSWSGTTGAVTQEMLLVLHTAVIAAALLPHRVSKAVCGQMFVF